MFCLTVSSSHFLELRLLLVRFPVSICSRYSSIAQSVERMTVNHDVTGSSPVRGAKKKASRETCFFLSNPKDWYGITRRVYGIRRKATAWHHASACILLRIDYIHHSVLIPYRRHAADFIHGFAVIFYYSPSRTLSCTRFFFFYNLGLELK